MPARTKKSTPVTTTAIAKPGETELIEPAVAGDVIDEVYETVRGIARDAGVQFHVDVGRVIFEKFYGGDADAFRSRGAKDASLRKLAERFEKDKDAPDGTSAPALYRAVGVYELDQRLGVAARKHLTLTHLRAVLGLPEAEQQKLLDQAEEKEWTTRQLEDKAAGVRKKVADGRGRPPLPSFVKAIHKLEKMLEGGDETFGDLDAVEKLEAEEATELYQAVTGMKLKCEELQKALEKKATGFGSRK